MTELIMRRNRYAPAERHAAHAHGYTNISLVLRGALLERVGSAQEYATALSVVVKPLDTEHANVFGPAGATLLQLRVPDEWNVALSDPCLPRLDWHWGRSLTTARWMLRIAALRKDDYVGDALAECLGAIGESARQPHSSAPDWIRRIRERIADECTSRVRVSELARDADVHPVHLTREFRRYYGTSIVGCLQQERVRSAAAALSNETTPISRVALNSGFADQPHLTRIFKRECGVTPAVFRESAQS